MLATLTLILAACANGGGAKLSANRQLPAAPACMNPVTIPQIRLADDARLAFATRSDALKLANKNLRCSRGWYEDVRKNYGGPK